MSVNSLGNPVPSPKAAQIDPLRLKPLTGSAAGDYQILDRCLVKSLPLASALAHADPTTLPLLPHTPGLARHQRTTATSLLSFAPKASSNPVPKADPKAAPKPSSNPAPKAEPKAAPKAAPQAEKKDEGNFLQAGLRWFGDTAGAVVRGVGDVTGTVVGEVVKNNPLALVSRASSGVAGMLGAPKEVTDALASVDKGSGALGDVTRSAVRGVGEFGAGTVEGVAELAADPLAAAQGIGIMATSAADAVPLLGDLTSGAEAMIRGTSVEKVRQEKQGNREAIWNGIVAEHQAVEGRVGTVGAWVKAGLDVGSIVKSGAVQGGKTAARVGADAAGLADEAVQGSGKTARVGADAAGLADEAARGSGKTARVGEDAAGLADEAVQGSGKTARVGAVPPERLSPPDDLVVRRSATSPAKPGDAGKATGAKAAVEEVAEEYRPYYPNRAKNATSQLSIDVDDLAQRMARAAEAIHDVAPTAKNIYSTAERRVIDAEVKNVLARAEREGRIPAGIRVIDDLQQVTGWLIANELKAHGLKLTEKTLKSYLPYKVSSREYHNLDGLKRTRIETEHAAGNATGFSFIMARRALQEKPDVLRTASGDLKVFNATERELFILETASDDMARYAPKLREKLGEVQFERFIESTVLRYDEALDGAGNYVDRSKAVSGSTEGHAITSKTLRELDNTVVIKKTPGETGTRTLQKLREKYGNATIPEHYLALSKLRGTIYHETAHLLDLRGLISEAPGTPFGKGTRIDGSRGDDFVSEYAKKDPAEDFAETVRFVIELQTQKTPDIFGGHPISDPLRAKLIAAADAIGTPREALQRLPGW